jgi:hypothetical protein
VGGGGGSERKKRVKKIMKYCKGKVKRNKEERR